jgi:hypothetical protein
MKYQSDTETIIKAMYILSNDVQSQDGIANVAIREAADRLQQYFDSYGEIILLRSGK